MVLKKFAIKHDLVPTSTRWKKAVSGIGTMYMNILEMMSKNYGPEGTKKLNKVMYNIGRRQSKEILGTLKLKRDLEGCAYSLMAMHRIFGIKSRIVEKNKDKLVIQITDCYWGRRKKGWTPKTCASIGKYEDGLVAGILPKAHLFYQKRQTLGHNVCELVIKQSRK